LKKQEGKLLIVDDDAAILHALRLLLKNYFDKIDVCDKPDEISRLLGEENYDLVLLDMNFSKGSDTGAEGLFWLKKIRQQSPDIAVVLITAYGNVNLAIQAIKEGAADFVLKPWVNEKLLATLSTVMNLHRAQKEISTMREERNAIQQDIRKSLGDIIGESEAMQEVFSIVRKVAITDANVLILGENGTGKEMIARSLHANSRRNNEAFITVDMGAIPETLFESELFGHVKGAFTDARESRPGRFEIATNGTLFLDEIGNMSMTMQSKLLTALQSRKIIRVGSNKEINIDIRLICATNRSIHKMVEESSSRQDLHYRINTIEIQLPPLRERKGDISLLARHYLGYYGKKYGKWPVNISAAALRRLEEYNWPGNVRELQHSIERALILCNSSTLQPDDFLFPSSQKRSGNELVIEDYNLENAEKMIIIRALEKTQGNISRAAMQLGLTRAALYRRMEKYGL
jgi:DNA-binding NtrC family response regulator